jgi:imidazolonepropionase-like amidohydrolase
MTGRPVHVFVLLLLVLAGCGKSHEFVTPLAGQPDTFVIRNVRVFDAPRAALLDGPRDVLVREGRIAAVEKPGEVHEAVREIDGSGKTLVPGLIDVHVHSGGSASPSWHTELPDTDENLGALLYAGVTTALDAAGLTPAVFRVRDDIRSGKKLGPRLFAAGPMFTGPGGHPVGIMRETLPFWARWYAIPRLTRQVATPDEARHAVADLLPEHPDVLKIAVDQLPIEPRIGTDVVAAVAAAGHEQHIRSVAHVGRSVDVLDSVHSGVDAMMHSPYQEEISDEAVAALAAKGLPVVATLAVWDAVERVGTVRAGDFTPLEREIAKPAVLEALTTAPASWTAGPTAEMVRQLAAAHPARRRNVQKLRAAGVTILAGSDAANLGQFPGAGLHIELAKLVEAGMTAGEALRAATSDNARFLEGDAPEAGEVAVGRRADLVLIDGDPTADIAALDRISRVFLGGVELERHPRDGT